jgi:ribosome-dependent ATPase
MDEADRFDWLVAMDNGKILATGTPREFHERTGTETLEAAFIALLPEDKTRGYRAVVIPPLVAGEQAEIAIEAEDLTKRFGDFVAVDHVNFEVGAGEVVGYLGPNGSGKTTTIRMLLGLLEPSDGKATVLGFDAFKQSEQVRTRAG